MSESYEDNIANLRGAANLLRAHQDNAPAEFVEQAADAMTTLVKERDEAERVIARMETILKSTGLTNARFKSELDLAQAEVARLREALTSLARWSECFVKNTGISAETLWREFPAALDEANAALQETATGDSDAE